MSLDSLRSWRSFDAQPCLYPSTSSLLSRTPSGQALSLTSSGRSAFSALGAASLLPHSGAQRNLQLSRRRVSHTVDVFLTSCRATPRVSPAPHTALRSCRLWSSVGSTRSAVVSSAAPLAPKPALRGGGALAATPASLVQFGTQGTRKLTVTKGARCCRIYRRPLGNLKSHPRNWASRPQSGMPGNVRSNVCVPFALSFVPQPPLP